MPAKQSYEDECGEETRRSAGQIEPRRRNSVSCELSATLLVGLCYLPSDHRAKFRGGSSRVPATRLLAARRNYQKSSKKTEKPSAATAGVFLQFWRGAIDMRSRALSLTRSQVYTASPDERVEGPRGGGRNEETRRTGRMTRHRLRDDVVRLYDACFLRAVDGRAVCKVDTVDVTLLFRACLN